MNAHGAKTWVEIDAGAYQSNLQALKSLLSPEVALCCVLKANAYGHDLETMAHLAHDNGIRHFGVDSIDEAQRIQKLYQDSDIFILGWTVPERYSEVVRNGFIQVVYTKQMITLAAEAAQKEQTPARVSLKIETGTQRQGVTSVQLSSVLRHLDQHRNDVQLVSVASHFAVSEDLTKTASTQGQYAVFKEALEQIHHAAFEPRFVHMACSAAVLQNPAWQQSMVRVGLAQYGLWPDTKLKQQTIARKGIELKPVMSWKTHIAQVKDVPAGAPVGYGQTYVRDYPTRIAVLPVGYYDGYHRALRDSSHVLIKGQKCPVIGTICMNICMVDVSHVVDAKQGDVVTLLGRDGMNVITAEDLATWQNTINYEAVTNIKPHLPRIVV